MLTDSKFCKFKPINENANGSYTGKQNLLNLLVPSLTAMLANDTTRRSTWALNIKQQKPVIIKRQETNEGSPTITPAYYLEKFSDHNAVKRNPDRAQSFPWIEKMGLSVQGSLDSYNDQGRLAQKKELHRNTTPEFPSSIRAMSVRKLSKAWERMTLRQLEKTVTECHIRLEYFLFPKAIVKNLII